METVKRQFCFLLFIVLPTCFFLSCNNAGTTQLNDIIIFTSFRDVPGITEEEIWAIEALQAEQSYFVYGMPLSTEAFENESGGISGFSALVCEWLTQLFEIPFRPALFEWNDLIGGMASFDICFSGELTYTEARRYVYHMTSAIALRPVKAFRIAGSRPLWEIAESRPIRAGFIEGAATIGAVTSEMASGTFEVIQINDFRLVYEALKSGKIDAFYYSAVAEVNFINYIDVIAHDFYPLTYMPVSLSTRNPAFEPIISVVEKVLNSGGLRYLTMLYNQTYQDYLKYKLFMQFTEEEHAYILNNPVVPIGVDPGNYPASFFDRREREWRGIFLDILHEVEALSGLTFERVNDEYAKWPEIYQMIVDGEIALVAELSQTAERAGRFIWPQTAQLVDYYALISHNDFPDIKINEVLYAKIGLAKDTAYTDIFRKWFPSHVDTIEYESIHDAFYALMRGEVDMVMANQKRLLYLTHYLELPDYKVNIVFDYALNIKLGLNKEEVILCSIIDKALRNINTKGISDYWMRRTYDYSKKLAQARMPWIIGAGVLFSFVLLLLVILFERSRRTGKQLEELVQKRTHELKKMEVAALAASKSKSTFLANMSHEIRTPMNAILGITEILVQYESLPAEIEEGLNKIYSSCDLLLCIINDILDFSKIEAGKLDIMPAQYKLASLINDSVHLNMMRIESKPIEFELNVDENIPAELIGDELRIKQILNNLLSNAFKYTDKGKVTLTVESESSLNNQIILIINVQDTGHGMTKEQLNEMFNEYSRFNQEKNISVEGTGLGMAITQRLVNLMNGEMHIESEQGKGSLFRVRLVQLIVGDEVLGSEVVQNLRQFRSKYILNKKRGTLVRDLMPYGKILVVDDVETNLYVAAGLMKLYKLKIDTAMSGMEAIDKVKSGNEYDVVFMDHMMPEMDGIETVKLIREWETEQGVADKHKHVIVALTANAVTGQADVFLGNGFDDFISKPIDIRQLNAILNKFVRDKQPPEVIEAARHQKESIDINSSNAEASQANALLSESFIRDAQKAVVVLETLCGKTDEWYKNEEDMRKFVITVHGIKSALGSIGENEIAELAYKLEMAGRNRDTDVIPQFTPKLIKNLQSLLENFESKQGNDGTDDIENICGILSEIQQMCAMYDRKGALDLITSVKDCSKKTRETLNNIMGYVIHSEFDDAGNAAGLYLEMVQKGNVASKLSNKEIPGLNITKGLHRYDDDEEVYLKILRSYSSSVRSMLSIIENFSEDKIGDYRIKVHGIKGTSFDVFAEQVGKEASALEDAAKAGNFKYIEENNPIFVENVRKLVYDIDTLLSILDMENPKPRKDKPDHVWLSMLLAACKDYDMDKADAAFAEIEKYQYESDDGLAEWLREQIEKMDFTTIVKKLSDL